MHTQFPNLESLKLTKLANSVETLLALWDAREVVEIRAAQLAALRHTEEQLAAIEHPIKLIGLVSSSAYRDTDLNLEFHLAIAGASGNPFLRRIINDLINDFRRIDFKHLLPAEQWNDLQILHREILEPIRDRNAAAAGTAMAKHFGGLRRSLEEAASIPSVIPPIQQ